MSMFAATKKIIKGPTLERASPTIINLRRRFAISALLPRTPPTSQSISLQLNSPIAPSPGISTRLARCSQRHHPRPLHQPQAAVISSLAATAPDMLSALPISKLIAAMVALGTGVLSAMAWLDAKRKTQKPGLQYTPNWFNTRVLSACPSLHLPYKPLPFFTNPHVETILAAKTRSKPRVQYRREVLVMADGGRVALDWEAGEEGGAEPLPPSAPVLLLLPGLTGGSGDSYVLHAVASARAAGLRAVVFNSRGTADSPVTTPQFYSASFTGDLRPPTSPVNSQVSKCHPSSRALLGAGWSLGANILLRYLGEEGAATPLVAAVSLCNPFNLTVSNEGLTRGFNRLYDTNLALALRRIFAKHATLWTDMPPPFRPADVSTCRTIAEFDAAITIHSFCWTSVEQYYAGSSSSNSIPSITIPTLCIQALDDPIAPKEAIPFEALRHNPNCTLVTTLTGGHLGWVAGPTAPFGAPWTDKVMFEWLTTVVKELAPTQKQTTVCESEEALTATVQAG